MEKTKLNRFISKYYLNGIAESVIWKQSNSTLSVKIVDEGKSLIGEVVCDKSDFPDSEFGVNQTSKLRSLLGILAETVDVNIVTKDSIAEVMQISGNNVNIDYVLSDMSIIPKVPSSKVIPPWELTLVVDEKFTENFVKATNALNDVREFAVISKNDKVDFVVGHSNISTTKVAINIEAKSYSDMPTTYFPTSHLKEILTANKEAKVGKIEVSSKGLMRVAFHVDEFKSTYFLVAKQDTNN